MAYLESFGAYLPERVVGNAEVARAVGCDAEWIRSVSGIETRHFAAETETVADMAAAAAQRCLERAGVRPAELGLLIVSSGSSERRFPGPAATVAHRLGLDSVPAVDLPIASAGSLFGLALAGRLAQSYGRILVLASEKMSAVTFREPLDANISVLFGDGAGACLVSAQGGLAEIVDDQLFSDGSFASDLRLELEGPLAMNGQVVILQAARKLPRCFEGLLAKHSVAAADVQVYLMHQANQNLLVRVARALKVPEERFFSTIARYGNTSSASLLIAASEWLERQRFAAGVPSLLGAFGAGFHWGAMLVKGC